MSDLPTSRASPDATSLGRGQWRRTHPLLGLFPLAVIAIACALLLFSFAMAASKPGSERDTGAGGAPRALQQVVARLR